MDKDILEDIKKVLKADPDPKIELIAHILTEMLNPLLYVLGDIKGHDEKMGKQLSRDICVALLCSTHDNFDEVITAFEKMKRGVVKMDKKIIMEA